MSQTPAGYRFCLACQVTPLSRYNPDPLCSVCARRIECAWFAHDAEESARNPAAFTAE